MMSLAHGLGSGPDAPWLMTSEMSWVNHGALLAWWLPPLDDLFVMDSDGMMALQFPLGALFTGAAIVIAVASVFWGVLAATRED